jgi:hypothetical protein
MSLSLLSLSLSLNYSPPSSLNPTLASSLIPKLASPCQVIWTHKARTALGASSSVLDPEVLVFGSPLQPPETAPAGSGAGAASFAPQTAPAAAEERHLASMFMATDLPPTSAAHVAHELGVPSGFNVDELQLLVTPPLSHTRCSLLLGPTGHIHLSSDEMLDNCFLPDPC